MASLAEWLAKRVGILIVLAAFGVSVSLLAALLIWAFPAIAAPPSWMAEVSASKMVTATWQGAIAIALVIGGIVSAYKFDLFREGKPHLTIDLTVSSRPVNARDAHVGVAARLHNTSKVLVDVEEVDWEVAAIAPYLEEDIDELIGVLDSDSSGSGTPIELEDATVWGEFPWLVLDSHRPSDLEMVVEPGQTEQITHDFVISADVESVAVSVNVKNILAQEGAGWLRREFHDVRR